MKRFALIGAAGFIAPRHLKAIKANNGELVAAMDKFDSVGILDHYFPDAHFFTEQERFDRFIEKMKIEKKPINYLSVCTPNYLHDAHIRFGLRNHMDVICEKPIVLNPWNLDSLLEVEQETGRRVFTILQLRHHSDIKALKSRVDNNTNDHFFEVDLVYITSRGRWYERSWKGDLEKSGGITTNIGVHFFDMLFWIFGKPTGNEVDFHHNDKAKGVLYFNNAKVNWLLSINESDLPEIERQKGKRTFRCINIDGVPLEFSSGFEDLHNECYKAILNGEGFGISDVADTIQLIHDLRQNT